MQQEKKNKKLALLFWVLSAVCMGIIFYFSSRTADISAKQSAGILDFIFRIFGENTVTDFIVRKSAHCLEYTGLCLLVNCAFYFSRGKISVPYSLLVCVIYAATDEIHQKFVEGRSCELRDLCIDAFGAVLGTIGFLVIFRIIKAIKDNHIKRKEK